MEREKGESRLRLKDRNQIKYIYSVRPLLWNGINESEIKTVGLKI
jgi:hypothetical protein